ncbi:MAG TPA: 30S ribosome-binding factor RbfA [Candidatus Polarisedimenticolaceae bacterium]|nr:30S ribosome-binding factor RbfA [Candidatus Polarisedimenticolaceae bacterium]
MTHRRNERVGEEIRAVLAEAVREIRDPRVGFVTLTGVVLSPDLKQAKVYVSRLGSASERDDAVDALNEAVAFLRRAVSTRAKLRHTPLLRFFSDATLERGSRVEAILQELHADDPEDEPDSR